MDEKTNVFQIVLIAVFALFTIAGVLIFSKAKTSQSADLPRVVIWGTISKGNFTQVYDEINGSRDKKIGKLNVDYVEKRADGFEMELIEALAAGEGPDSIIMPQEQIARYKNKIFTIPYESLPLRDFKETYISGADLFLTDTGALGVPFYTDPLVMYWNKDIFESEGFPLPPTYWTEFFSLTEKLTLRDKKNNVVRSAVALGEYSNVNNSKEIISSLLFQAGTPIVKLEGDLMASVLNSGIYSGTLPAESVMGFYTEFSNPNKISYSWNRAMPYSKDAFIAGDLAIYFGFASELDDIRNKNPNLNFDVSLFPQPKDAKNKITYGKVYALSVLKSSKVISGAFQSVFALTGKDFVSLWVEKEKIAPARRDILAEQPKDPDMEIFYDSALISRGWLDPNPPETDLIFKDMTESISTGRLRVSDAVTKASNSLGGIIDKNK